MYCAFLLDTDEEKKHTPGIMQFLNERYLFKKRYNCINQDRLKKCMGLVLGSYLLLPFLYCYI